MGCGNSKDQAKKDNIVKKVDLKRGTDATVDSSIDNLIGNKIEIKYRPSIHIPT